MRNARRPAAVAFAVAFALGLAGLLLVAALDDRRLAFTLGVQPTLVAAVVQPGGVACQGPLDVPADAASVSFPVGTFRGPGPPLAVVVRTPDGVVGRAAVQAGYPDRSTVTARPGGIDSGARIAVCVRNAGRRKVALYGGAPQAARTSRLVVDGRNAGTDLTLVFERADSRSFLSALGDAFDRASLFRPSWVSAGLLWVLAILLVTAMPAALGAALSGATSGRIDPHAGDREADGPAGR